MSLSPKKTKLLVDSKLEIEEEEEANFINDNDAQVDSIENF